MKSIIILFRSCHVPCAISKGWNISKNFYCDNHEYIEKIPGIFDAYVNINYIIGKRRKNI